MVHVRYLLWIFPSAAAFYDQARQILSPGVGRGLALFQGGVDPLGQEVAASDINYQHKFNH